MRKTRWPYNVEFLKRGNGNCLSHLICKVKSTGQVNSNCKGPGTSSKALESVSTIIRCTYFLVFACFCMRETQEKGRGQGAVKTRLCGTFFFGAAVLRVISVMLSCQGPGNINRLRGPSNSPTQLGVSGKKCRGRVIQRLHSRDACPSRREHKGC